MLLFSRTGEKEKYVAFATMQDQSINQYINNEAKNFAGGMHVKTSCDESWVEYIQK